MSDNILVHLLIGELEDSPDGGLAAARGADNNAAHALSGRLVELKDFLDLRLDILELKLLKGLLDGHCELLIGNVLGLDAGEHVTLEGFIFPGVRISQL